MWSLSLFLFNVIERRVRTIKFNKTVCGVEFLLNVLDCSEVGQEYISTDIHNTDSFEILFFKKGSGHVYIENKRITIQNNTILFISPFQLKKWSVKSSELDFTLLVFQEEFLNEFFADKLFTYKLLYFYQYDHPIMLHTDRHKLQGLYNILQEMKSELISPSLDSAHIIRSLIYYLLQRLNRDYAIENGLPVQIDISNYAYNFKKLLEQNIKEKQRIQEYSDLLGISRITLNKAVKKQFNQTATEILKNRLITEIKNDLLYSNKTMSELAVEYGYSEPSHLMRFFKNQTGLTASEFQSAYQNGSLS